MSDPKYDISMASQLLYLFVGPLLFLAGLVMCFTPVFFFGFIAVPIGWRITQIGWRGQE